MNRGETARLVLKEVLSKEAYCWKLLKDQVYLTLSSYHFLLQIDWAVQDHNMRGNAMQC